VGTCADDEEAGIQSKKELQLYRVKGCREGWRRTYAEVVGGRRG
jgi:hypothetical protein